MPDSISTTQWVLALIAAISTGFSKGGFVGFGMVPVILMAEAFPARESTGIVLPMLICADLTAVAVFKQHAQWKTIWRLLPPAIAGIVLGYWLMDVIPGPAFRTTMGWVILGMVAVQVVRKWKGDLFQEHLHGKAFAWTMGGIAGATTMLANAAGPVATLYLMALNMQKMQFVGTIAWFFTIVNLIKVPFSAHLGLIDLHTITFNAALAPVVIAGVFIARALLKYIPQKVYEILLLLFSAAASIRLILT